MTTSNHKKENAFASWTSNITFVVLIMGLLLPVVGCGRPLYQPPDQQVSHSSHNAEMFNDRGNGYVLKHEYKLAVHNYTEAIRLDRNYPDAYCNRAGVYVQNGASELAIADLDRAIQLKPDFGRAFYLRGTAWEQLGDTAKAKDDLNRAKELGYAPKEQI